jgi:hypothetical protein
MLGHNMEADGAPDYNTVVVSYSNPSAMKHVFGEDLDRKIKRPSGNECNTAVTGYFPRVVDATSVCRVVLEIGAEHVRELAKTLFKIEVEWVADAFRVVHENGMTQTIE